VRSGDGKLYAYPDISVACDPRFLEDSQRTLLNPILIIEVLSDSIESYDRGLKFERYQTTESLREYLLISSTRVHADLFSRQADGRWVLTPAGSLEDSLVLASCGCTLLLGDIYDRLTFPELDTPAS
jgi:Uma2 family endonuclease